MTDKLRILSVGSNAISAFYSWRLQASNACETTLVWRSTFEAVQSFGITFKSQAFGTDRFKPYSVVRAVEDAADPQRPFDYVFVCVKALPDVYDLASVIESVVTPAHTCILVNTTNTIGVERSLQDRFPRNLVLSFVSGATLSQTGPAEFEQTGKADAWIGTVGGKSPLPEEMQKDMAESLALTLEAGMVDCHLSKNILQQQFEKMIGPIGFHPISVLMQEPNLQALVENQTIKELITDIIDELLNIAYTAGCSFPEGYRDQVINEMTSAPTATPSMMYQDYLARRPMEIEVFLGNPLFMAKELGLSAGRLQTMYALLQHTNIMNQKQAHLPPPPVGATSPVMPRPMSRRQSNVSVRPPMVPPSTSQHRMPLPPRTHTEPMMAPRRPPPNGYPPQAMMNGRGARTAPPQSVSRQNSVEDLQEFADIALYGDQVGQDSSDGPYMRPRQRNPEQDMQIRERELALRQRELALREREMALSQGRGPAGPPPVSVPKARSGKVSRKKSTMDFDDSDDGDDFAPIGGGAPMLPPGVNPDEIDMIAFTAKKRAMRGKPPGRPAAAIAGSGRSMTFTGRFRLPRNRSSANVHNDGLAGLNDPIMEHPMHSFASNRYPGVDTKSLVDTSRANSLTAASLAEREGPYPSMQGPSMSRGGPYPGQMGVGGIPNRGYPPPSMNPSMVSLRSARDGPYPSGPYPGAMSNGNGPYPPRGPPPVKSPMNDPYRSVTGSASASGGSGSQHGDIGENASGNSSTSSFERAQHHQQRAQNVI
ncbi:hypothetical protein YB2330_005359 [Saitoella coloradoensis]